MKEYIDLIRQAEITRILAYDIEKQLCAFEDKNKIPKSHRNQYLNQTKNP
jgi:hypothetical protein